MIQINMKIQPELLAKVKKKLKGKSLSELVRTLLAEWAGAKKPDVVLGRPRKDGEE